MNRKRRPMAALVLVTLISLISAGCGSNSPAGTASSARVAGSVSGTGTGTASNGGNMNATKC